MMKKLLVLFGAWMLLSVRAQAAPPQYSNVWRPITEDGIRADVQHNHLNGVGLEQTMMRALLQSKSLPYLRAVKAASDAEPKNATLLAAYAWALAMVKNSYTFSEKAQPVPERLKEFNFDWQNIRDTLQRAKDLDSHCWLAYVAESTLDSGGPPPTKEASALKTAFQIQRNPVTLTRYGSALMFQAAGAQDLKGQQQGMRLLLLAERLYPNYYKSSYWVYRAYGYPRVADEPKKMAALQRFYLNVPPEYRKAPWVVRYFKFLNLEKRLNQLGVTL